jgi:hypothetical protein
MKMKDLYRINWMIFGGLLLMICPISLTGQDDKPLTTRVDLTCIQELNKDIQLSAKLRAKEGRSYVPVEGETVSFTGLQEDEYLELGEAVTDKNGDAVLTVNNLEKLSIDDDGYYTVSAYYEGSDDYEENEEEFMFKRGYMEMKTMEEDGTKSVQISVYAIEDEEQIPIEEVEAKVGVPMLFSQLPIGSDYTDEEGYLEFEFPNDLPGDKDGNVTLIAEALETDDFGVLRASEVKQWGIPKAVVIEKTRTLWSPNAPLWMVITFTMLMLAVWGHFIYIIYRLYLMSKEGKMVLKNN